MTLKQINPHMPAVKLLTLQQFGFFLAGLMDADGHINKLGYTVIAFHRRDTSVAYYIKSVVGYGKVHNHATKKAACYICSHSAGNRFIAHLIHNKLINPVRVMQYNSRWVPKISVTKTTLDKLCLNNHWLAGFIQGDGSFQIKVVAKAGGDEIRLVVQIDQKHKHVLDQIHALLGGYLGHRVSQNTYYYSSVSFGRAAKFIAYLDAHTVMGSCLTLYWMWRKCYIIVQQAGHLNQSGIQRIVKIKAQMSRLRQN